MVTSCNNVTSAVVVVQRHGPVQRLPGPESVVQPSRLATVLLCASSSSSNGLRYPGTLLFAPFTSAEHIPAVVSVARLPLGYERLNTVHQCDGPIAVTVNDVAPLLAPGTVGNIAMDF